ncbi:Cyclin-D2-1 plant protein [Dioscorea alata]|uniref:Cyclin-D2-1 plant protein n=1 Tax=Dioscorea alata TaxID=55571 RepID=A0ACB7UPR5_DIOAL|nr:Cyclin-D2-1 plant protein [Dioscorea alata]
MLSSVSFLITIKKLGTASLFPEFRSTASLAFSFPSYLAINYIDRFLARQREKPWVARLLALSCLFLTSKMKNSEFSLPDFQNASAVSTTA